MKKKILITSFALLIIFSIGLGANYLLSLRKVSFILENGTDEITIYTKDDKKIEHLPSDGHILVQAGEYYLIPSGDNLASDPVEFLVEKDDKTVTVRPSYTEDFLADILEEERAAIEGAITKKYPSVPNDYTLAQGALYGQGDWFGGLLKPKVSDIREQKDPYRVVLHKKDGKWEIIRRPEYVLTASRYQEVPINILREINSIVGEPGN